MNLEFLERFLALLAERTGLHVREKDRHVLARTLESRLAEGSRTPDDYLRALERDTALTGEWKVLMPRLTNGESYFLRDKGQMELLRGKLLPELLALRQKEHSLRLWSAGCSSGEEPYTLAMLLSELLPQRAEWQISVIGTDINEAALEKARRGVYGTWAFRSVPDEVRARHFTATEKGLEIKPELREMVRFASLNLRESVYPGRDNSLHDIDLILCRNVLIYFNRETVAHALKGFTATLRTGGYLLTGHAELAGHDPAPLTVRAFAESVAYQKREVPSQERAMPVSPFSGNTVRPSSTQRLRPLSPPPGRAQTGTSGNVAPVRRPGLQSASPKPLRAPAAVPKPATPVAVTYPTVETSAKLCDAARSAADAGRYEDAERLCREAVTADAVNIDAYALWAHVTGERGNAPEAKNFWKKVIYLAPSHVEAYVELGALYEGEGDARRARQMRETAINLLRAEESRPSPAISPKDATPPGEREALKRHLEELTGTSGQDKAALHKSPGGRRP